MTAPAPVPQPIARSSVVIAPHRPEWGVGIVVALDGPEARVFFLEGGRRTVDLAAVSLAIEKQSSLQSDVVSAVARSRPAAWARSHHHVYVIALSDDVRTSARFIKQNPRMQAGKPCVYVGLTGLTPAERFANHRAHHKSGRYAGSHGRRLLHVLYERFNPMPFRVGAAFEPYLAGVLRRKGYGVWQN